MTSSSPGTESTPGLDRARLGPVLGKVADRLVELPYKAWSFGDSVGFEGMVAASAALSDGRWLEFARGFIRSWASYARQFAPLDCTAPGHAMVQVYRRTKDALVLQAALDLAQYLVQRRRIEGVFATFERTPLQKPYGEEPLTAPELQLLADPPAGVFVDCLHFDPPFLVSLGAVTNDQRWIDQGVEQALGYVRILQQPDGLFDHFGLEGSSQTYGHAWGRGQGWALLGLIEVLDDLPQRHPLRPDLERAAGRLAQAMAAHQREDGSWYAVVDEPSSGDEPSTSAFMAAGMRRAVRSGLVDRADSIGRAADRALEAALKATDEDGVLTGVSAAVGASTHQSHYAGVPRFFVVPWGQGPLALAIAERLKGDKLVGG